MQPILFGGRSEDGLLAHAHGAPVVRLARLVERVVELLARRLASQLQPGLRDAGVIIGDHRPADTPPIGRARRVSARHVGLGQGRPVDLQRLAAQGAPHGAVPPLEGEWAQLEEAEAASGLDVTKEAKLNQGDLLKVFLPAAEKEFAERSEAEKAEMSRWYPKLSWYTSLRKVGLVPSFGGAPRATLAFRPTPSLCDPLSRPGQHRLHRNHRALRVRQDVVAHLGRHPAEAHGAASVADGLDPVAAEAVDVGVVGADEDGDAAGVVGVGARERVVGVDRVVAVVERLHPVVLSQGAEAREVEPAPLRAR